MKTTRKAGKKLAAKKGINEEEISKIDSVEGEEAFDNFTNLTRQLLSVPKSEIVEMERKRKKKT
jgi:DNA-binding Xre family transcriptional regulator